MNKRAKAFTIRTGDVILLEGDSAGNYEPNFWSEAVEKMRQAEVMSRYPPGPWPFQRSNPGRRT